jgi:hypothetical protein
LTPPTLVLTHYYYTGGGNKAVSLADIKTMAVLLPTVRNGK